MTQRTWGAFEVQEHTLDMYPRESVAVLGAACSMEAIRLVGAFRSAVVGYARGHRTQQDIARLGTLVSSEHDPLKRRHIYYFTLPTWSDRSNPDPEDTVLGDTARTYLGLAAAHGLLQEMEAAGVQFTEIHPHNKPPRASRKWTMRTWSVYWPMTSGALSGKVTVEVHMGVVLRFELQHVYAPRPEIYPRVAQWLDYVGATWGQVERNDTAANEFGWEASLDRVRRAAVSTEVFDEEVPDNRFAWAPYVHHVYPRDTGAELDVIPGPKGDRCFIVPRDWSQVRLPDDVRPTQPAAPLFVHRPGWNEDTAPPPTCDVQMERLACATLPDSRRVAGEMSADYRIECLTDEPPGHGVQPHEWMFHKRRVVIPTRSDNLRGRTARAVVVATYRKSLRAWGLRVDEETHRGNATVAGISAGSMLVYGGIGGWLEVVERFGETFVTLYLQERPDPPDNQLERSFGGNPPKFAVWARLSDPPGRSATHAGCFGWLYIEHGMLDGPGPVHACEAFATPHPDSQDRPKGMEYVCMHPGGGREGAAWRTARSPWAALVPYWTMSTWYENVQRSIAGSDYTGDLACALLRLGLERVRGAKLWVRTTWCLPGTAPRAVVFKILADTDGAPLNTQDIAFDDEGLDDVGDGPMRFRLMGEEMCGAVVYTLTASKRAAWAVWAVWRVRDEDNADAQEADADAEET